MALSILGLDYDDTFSNIFMYISNMLCTVNSYVLFLIGTMGLLLSNQNNRESGANYRRTIFCCYLYIKKGCTLYTSHIFVPEVWCGIFSQPRWRSKVCPFTRSTLPSTPGFKYT